MHARSRAHMLRRSGACPCKQGLLVGAPPPAPPHAVGSTQLHTRASAVLRRPLARQAAGRAAARAPRRDAAGIAACCATAARRLRICP